MIFKTQKCLGTNYVVDLDKYHLTFRDALANIITDNLFDNASGSIYVYKKSEKQKLVDYDYSNSCDRKVIYIDNIKEIVNEYNKYDVMEIRWEPIALLYNINWYIFVE